MKNSVLFFVLSFFFFPFTFADNSKVSDLARENKAGIYFCTRDVEENILGLSPAIASDKSWDNYDDIGMIVVDDRDSPKHKYLRHCFVLLAEEIAQKGDTGEMIYIQRGFFFKKQWTMIMVDVQHLKIE